MSPADRDPRAEDAAAGGADDAERDAWLREALRHAPDAAAAPPPALREAILAQARAATRSPSRGRRTAAGAGSVFWAWLTRPALASGFAGLMAATLVGLLWWDQPMDLALPPPAAPARTPAPPAAADAAPPEAMNDAGTKPQQAAPREHAQAFPQRDTKAAATTPATSEERLARQDSRGAADAGTAPAAAVITAPAPQPAAPVRERQGSRAGETLTRAAPAPSSVTPPLASNRSDRIEQAETTSRDAASKAMQPAQLDASRSLEPLLASVAADPSRWSWRTGGADVRPLDDSTRRWLADLDAATRSRWQAVSPDTSALPNAGSASAGAASLVLLFDGKPAAVFRLDAAEAFLDSRLEGPTRASRAALAPAEAARLRATLPR